VSPLQECFVIAFDEGHHRKAQVPTIQEGIDDLIGYEAAKRIKALFLQSDIYTLDKILNDYAEVHGVGKANYAQDTFLKWKSGATNMSGQTLERLLDLVPKHLTPSQRIELAELVWTHFDRISHRPKSEFVTVDIDDPEPGMLVVEDAIKRRCEERSIDDFSDNIIRALTWLADDDMSVFRNLKLRIEEVRTHEAEVASERELDQLWDLLDGDDIDVIRQTIELPDGNIVVTITRPPKRWGFFSWLFGN
jgi:hypothetical protein